MITQTILNPKQGDVTVFGGSEINHRNWIIGVTDLNRDVVATKSTQVTTDSTQVKRILSIIENNFVKRICLMHSMVAENLKEMELLSEIIRKVQIIWNCWKI
ncbi:MAG: hypothetical protein IPN14_08615 [Bacteroidetes bacterium]|nr:hypothetical protein [Bacteroidota bacterium]